LSLISLVAAVDDNMGIGKNNALLCHLPLDLKHFKQLTLHKPIIMGRKTFESIGRPLPDRMNVVLSTQMQAIEGIQLASSLNEALNMTRDAKEIMVIGGAKVFKDALPFATRMHLTQIHHAFEADVFFPDFNRSEWQCVASTFHGQDEKNAYDMTFYCYERI
tara:strand:- start:380 stop:865 length:486 start_codon:yes stop_codon:yes gene_type:complete